MENKKRIVFYLRDIKNGKLKMNIDFFDEGGQKIGVLKPVLSDHIRDNSDIAKFITKWRTYYKDNFFTQFEATEERTKNWLETQVINRDDKILFMIETNDKKIVGHAGVVFQEDYTLGELDNIVKDKDCKIPGIMTYSLKALINFLFNFLKIELLTLRVFSDNLKALALYSRCGFSKVKEIGLRKETTDDEIRYVEIRENNFQTADNTMFVMNLRKEDFNKNIKKFNT